MERLKEKCLSQFQIKEAFEDVGLLFSPRLMVIKVQVNSQQSHKWGIKVPAHSSHSAKTNQNIIDLGDCAPVVSKGKYTNTK